MTYVITEKCVATCDTACVDVCPVDCIIGPLPREQMRAAPGLQMFIDPDECIGCGACAPECPVDAIYDESLAPPADIARNADFFALRRKR